jgi:hypothetical protein
MKQKDLCNKIGMADRSFRRLSPAKRKQWQALANNGRTAAFMMCWLSYALRLMRLMQQIRLNGFGCELTLAALQLQGFTC